MMTQTNKINQVSTIPLGSKIYIAGHKGLVGSAIKRLLEKKGHTQIITRTRNEVDLTNHKTVFDFFQETNPEYVFLAAAKVGGISANSSYPAEFITENLMIQTNIIEAAYKFKTKRLLFLGSSCIYPKMSPQPIKEEYLLTGLLEQTNEAYAIAKIAGLKMCESYNIQYGTKFIPVMPTNLYGEHDNFDLETSHVLPALINKFHTAKEKGDDSVTIWGTGTPKREFLHTNDLAEACIFIIGLEDYTDLTNIGTGQEITILELAKLVMKITGFKGKLIFDHSKPDGTPRKLLDISKLKNLGWSPKIELDEGIKSTYNWFKNQLQ